MDKTYILFDLDGTLTNPKEGITKSLQYALKAVGINVENLDTLERHIGPPLAEGLREFWGLDEEQVKEACIKYREYFKAGGIFMNLKYEGIDGLLGELVQSGKVLLVATSKPEMFAREILVHFGLDGYFHDICGATSDEIRTKKGDIIAYALEKNGIRNREQAVMIGDRLYDIAGARESGISSIGVLYGFGSREELEAAGADALAEDFKVLREILLG